MNEIIHTYWQSFLYFDGDQLSGVAMTLLLLVVSTVGGFLLSIPLALARVSNNRLLSGAVWIYTYLFRSSPLYVQLLIIYSGLYGLEVVQQTHLLNEFFRNPLNCTLLAFVLNECAYMTEILVGTIRSCNRGEVEAGKAFGMSSWALRRKIILPAALRRALPAYSNEVIFMLHGTTVAFTATVPDILKVARDVNAATYLTFQSFTLASLLYLAISCVAIFAFRKAEKRWLKHLAPTRPHTPSSTPANGEVSPCTP